MTTSKKHDYEVVYFGAHVLLVYGVFYLFVFGRQLCASLWGVWRYGAWQFAWNQVMCVSRGPNIPMYILLVVVSNTHPVMSHRLLDVFFLLSVQLQSSSHARCFQVLYAYM